MSDLEVAQGFTTLSLSSRRLASRWCLSHLGAHHGYRRKKQKQNSTGNWCQPEDICLSLEMFTQGLHRMEHYTTYICLCGCIVLEYFHGLSKGRRGTFLSSSCGSALYRQPDRDYSSSHPLTLTGSFRNLSSMGQLSALRGRSAELGGWGGAESVSLVAIC